MKILLVNKFHYQKGGSETYYFGLGELLKKQGHQVIYFSMKDEQNVPDVNERFFVENVEFNGKQSPISLIKNAGHLLYSVEAFRKFKQYIQIEKPDIIHLNIFQSQLSASIVDAAYQCGIPIVYTAHDLKSICPNYQMLNHGQVCEKCLKGNYMHCFFSACMKDSRSKSLLAAMEMYVYRLRKTYQKLDLIVTPSAFYKRKISEAAITKAPIVHIPNFLPLNTQYTCKIGGDYFLYFGRLSREKGILTLIRAYAKTGRRFPLYIVGRGPMEEQILSLIKEKSLEEQVLLLGFKQGKELTDIVEHARCICLPSEWYENGPYSIMEAMAAGKPVIVSSYGGLPEMVDEDQNGFIVQAGNTEELKEALIKMEQEEILESFSIHALKKAKQNFDAEKYASVMVRYYQKVIERRQKE